MPQKRNLKKIGLLSRANSKTTNFVRGSYRKTTTLIQRKPFISFLVALFLLFSVIFLGNFLTPPPADDTREALVKEARVYRIGESPKVVVQAQVEKTGIIQITALAPGVINHINAIEGNYVKKGDNLIGLSSNYQGGNAASVQRQLASLQYKNVKDTFDAQKDLIQKQKDIANKTDANADELRSIADKSAADARGIIDLNDSILETIVDQQEAIEASPSAGTPVEQQTLQLRQLRAQLYSANAQLRSGLRNAEYQAASDKPAAQLSDLQREIAIKQLEIQEKSLELSKEVSRLQLVLAQVSEATMFPAAPFAGRVERVHVRYGQAVNPGTPLVTLSGDKGNLMAVVKTSESIAKNVSLSEMTSFIIDGERVDLYPSHISKEATDGQLYAIVYNLPEDLQGKLTDKGFVQAELPIGLADTSSAVPFVPLDSVFQTQDQTSLLVIDGTKAASRQITLGEVFGRFVEVTSGLQSGDQVITNRNVVTGDEIKIVN